MRAREARRSAGRREPAVDAVSVDIASHYWYLDATHAETVLGWQACDPMETLADTVTSDLRARGVVWPEPKSA
ncbi:MAG: hypothetical protein U0235_13410 [Polyangiaceae bacterium]